MGICTGVRITSEIRAKITRKFAINLGSRTRDRIGTERLGGARADLGTSIGPFNMRNIFTPNNTNWVFSKPAKFVLHLPFHRLTGLQSEAILALGGCSRRPLAVTGGPRLLAHPTHYAQYRVSYGSKAVFFSPCISDVVSPYPRAVVPSRTSLIYKYETISAPQIQFVRTCSAYKYSRTNIYVYVCSCNVCDGRSRARGWFEAIPGSSPCQDGSVKNNWRKKKETNLNRPSVEKKGQRERGG